MRKRDDAAELRLHYEALAEKVSFLDKYTKVMAGNIRATGGPSKVDVSAACSHISSAIANLEGMLVILRGHDGVSRA